MLMKSTTVVGLMTLLSVLAVFFAGRTHAQRFRGGMHGEELRTARRMEITPPSEALVDVDEREYEYYDDEDHNNELAVLRGGGHQRALTEKSKSKSKKSKSKSKKSKSKTEKSKKSKSDKGTKSTKKSKSEKKSDKGTKSTKKSKSDKGTKSTKKSKSNKSKSNKSKSMKSMTQRAAVLDRLQILNGGGVSTSLSNTNPQLAGRSGGLGLINMLENNDEMEIFGQKLPRANTNDGAEAETTLSKLAQLAAAAF